MVKGSSTVFLSLVLLLVASLLFTLLESARVNALQASACLKSELVTESLLAEYNIPLLERYHLFALDVGYGTSEVNTDAVVARAQALLKENSTSLAGDCVLQEYRLLTDDKGMAFYELVTNYMKNNIAQETVKRIYNEIQQVENAAEDAGDMEQKRSDALSDIEAAEKGQVQTDEGQEGDVIVQPSTEKPENPIEYVSKWKDIGILTLVGLNPDNHSNAGISRENCLEKRQKNNGNQKTDNEEAGWYEDILFQEYLIEYFGNHTNTKENTALSYELEYIVAGKNTDRENLTEVVTILLAIREAANFIYLQTDQARCSEALTLATLLVGFTGNALLVKGVQQGILAAWAFAESVSDVKSLLAGERIPILKSAAQWSTNVAKLSGEQDFEKSKDCTLGLSYEDYLRILLYTVSKEKKSYRALDLMELNLHMMTGYEQVRMDCMADSVAIKYAFTAKPLFLSMVTIGNVFVNGYRISIEQEKSYLER